MCRLQIQQVFFFFKCSHHPNLDFFYKKIFFCIFYFTDQLWKYLQKSRQTSLSRGNTIFNGFFPIACCGLAWETVTHQLMSFSLLALTCSSATTSQPTCWALWCLCPTQLRALLTCQQEHFKWNFLGTFLWQYAESARWKVKEFKDWFVLFSIKQCLEVLKPGGKFRILLEEPDGFQMSFLLTQPSSWPCFSG